MRKERAGNTVVSQPERGALVVLGQDVGGGESGWTSENLRVGCGLSQAHIAAAMGVSGKCVKTSIDRFAAEGETGLLTRSSRPPSMATRTSYEVEQMVLAARAEHRSGPDVLGPKVGVPQSATNVTGVANWTHGRHETRQDPRRRRLAGERQP